MSAAMTGRPPAALTASPAERGPPQRAARWRKARERMDPQEAMRQGEVARTAFAVFGDRDRALAFLNGSHGGLGGRPIDLAIASATGLEAVLDWLSQRSLVSPPDAQEAPKPPSL